MKTMTKKSVKSIRICLRFNWFTMSQGLFSQDLFEKLIFLLKGICYKSSAPIFQKPWYFISHGLKSQIISYLI